MPQSDTPNARLLDAILPHVPFDGWSDAAFTLAVQDAGIEPNLARALAPRKAVDLAAAYHYRGDAALADWLANDESLVNLRFRDKITKAVKWRLSWVEDKELVQRAATLFALPQNAALGAKLVWSTADTIWQGLGDRSDDYNYYTKRMTLSAVYSTTVLYWLGDSSDGSSETWAFLDRRIENVMQFEKAKAQARGNKALRGLLSGPLRMLSSLRAPQPQNDMPGRWRAD